MRKRPKIRKANTLRPDELDRLLVRELEADALQSLVDLGAKLDVAPTTVLRRIRKLRDAGAFDFVTGIEPQALGYQTRALIGIKMQPGSADDAVNALRSCHNVQLVIQTYGRYDVLTPTFFRNNEEIVAFVDQELGRLEHIANFDVFVFLEKLKDFGGAMGNRPSNTHNPQEHSLDELDLNLIKELELQPRTSTTTLSRRLGTSWQTIQTRLERLRSKGVINTVTLVDTRCFGLNVGALIFAKIQPGKVRDVAVALTHEDKVIQVAIMGGRFNLILWGIFRDSEEMSTFVRNNLGNIPWVMEYEVFIQVGLPKKPSTSVVHQIVPQQCP